MAYFPRGAATRAISFTPRIEPAFRAKLWRDTSESNYALLWRSTIY